MDILAESSHLAESIHRLGVVEDIGSVPLDSTVARTLREPGEGMISTQLNRWTQCASECLQDSRLSTINK